LSRCHCRSPQRKARRSRRQPTRQPKWLRLTRPNPCHRKAQPRKCRHRWSRHRLSRRRPLLFRSPLPKSQPPSRHRLRNRSLNPRSRSLPHRRNPLPSRRLQSRPSSPRHPHRHHPRQLRLHQSRLPSRSRSCWRGVTGCLPSATSPRHVCCMKRPPPGVVPVALCWLAGLLIQHICAAWVLAA
jgi:hypothetical protein